MSESLPWSHPLRWAELQRGTRVLSLVADAETLARIAKALDLEAAKSLSADLTLQPWLDGIRIDGRVEGVVTRICGVSLEPFDESVDEPLAVRIVPAGSSNAPAAAGAEVIIDPAADDPPDIQEGDVVDLGAYVVEHLALALDPFPRKPDAVFEPPPGGDPPSPFAVLARLKTPRED